MYSQDVKSALEERDISEGDEIKIEKEGEVYKGTLMPRSKTGNNDCIVIKLKNGYNLGIEFENVELEKLSEGKSKEKEKEAKEVEDADITILHTGGTIASKVSYSEGGVISKFSPKEILDMYPELEEIASVRSKLVEQMLSEDIEFSHYNKIAQAIKKEIKKGVKGVIISHGTDTMHYTSAALSLVLKNVPVPVILVGSQRSSDRPSSDAAMNLISAARFIMETNFKGVGICMHGASSDNYCVVHPGTHARKMHTSRRDAFKTIGDKPIAKINYPEGKIEFLKELKSEEGEFKLKNNFEEKVALVKTHPSLNPDIIDFYAEKNYKGIVIEGTGLGHAPVNPTESAREDHEKLLEGIERFIEKGGVVAMTSQCIHGRINMNVYETGRKLKEVGVISGKNMTPETAFVKLSWSLANSNSKKEAEDVFKTNIAGEIKDREEYNDFKNK